MKMIDVLKRELIGGMSISAEKELGSKWKVTISYSGMQSTIDLPKTCTPGCEQEVCRKAIDTALSTMYVNAGNLIEAKKWLNGEFWLENDTKQDSECECYIGIYWNYDDSELMTREEFEKLLTKTHLHVYTREQYCDRDFYTSLEKFDFCPKCGKKIDWDAIRENR